MHTVCQLHAFVRDARDAGMSDEEVQALVDYVAEHPMAGDEIAGTGGCRKLRWPGRGKGKSGGYRTITFFTGNDIPVFLVTVFGKGERANLSHKERNQLGRLTKELVAEYTQRVVNVRATR